MNLSQNVCYKIIDGSEKRKRHLALNFRIRSFLKRAVIGNQMVFSGVDKRRLKLFPDLTRQHLLHILMRNTEHKGGH